MRGSIANEQRYRIFNPSKIKMDSLQPQIRII